MPVFFFFNDTATTETYPLSLHDALPISMAAAGLDAAGVGRDEQALRRVGTFVELHVEQGRALVDTGAAVGVASSIWPHGRDRKSTRLNSSHANISYAVFCLKKKKQHTHD